MRKLILGGPGCGKTTRLLDLIEEILVEGTPPERIAFVSFTTKAANEAVDRAKERFSFPRDRFRHFRTIHSMAYRGAGVTHSEVMQKSDYLALGEELGVEFSMRADLAEGAGGGGKEGDQMLSLVDLARSTKRSLRDAWLDADSEIDWPALKRFNDGLTNYKERMGKIDFTDMLQRFLDFGDPIDCEVAFVDEAQDLSALQWEVVEHAFSRAERIVIAGDDDQAIHGWNGADINHFLRFDGEIEELPVSHRLPREIFTLASSIGERIEHRYPKTWQPTERQGGVSWIPSAEAVSPKEGSWLFLVRNKVFAREIEDTIEQQGYPYSTAWGSSIKPDHATAIYTWERLRKGSRVPGEHAEVMAKLLIKRPPRLTGEDYSIEDLPEALRSLDWSVPWHKALSFIGRRKIEYYRACLRRGEKLVAQPRIYIGTIHSVKGGEADNVVLCLDQTMRTFEHGERQPDDEHRVFYVGATRARKNLYLVPPQGEFGYQV